jgi:hypothetical protein
VGPRHLLQVEEEENIDVGITLTEDVQEQNGEEGTTTSSSTTVVTSESPTTVTTTTSVTTTATQEPSGTATTTSVQTTTTATTFTKATSASTFSGRLALLPPGEAEAIGVTLLIGVGVALVIAGTGGTILLNPNFDSGLAEGSLDLGYYDVSQGVNANAPGAFGAFAQGFFYGFFCSTGQPTGHS